MPYVLIRFTDVRILLNESMKVMTPVPEWYQLACNKYIS